MIILLGPPGVGKGTQCQRLVDKFDWAVVSTGERLRAAIRDGTPLGNEARAYMDAGRLVPFDIINRLVKQILDEAPADRIILFDGFPRTTEQAQALDAYAAQTGRPLRHVLLLSVDDDELRRRMLRRATKEGRSDDTPETIATRLATYRRKTEPLVEYYRNRGVLREIPGHGAPDEVFDHIQRALATSEK